LQDSAAQPAQTFSIQDAALMQPAIPIQEHTSCTCAQEPTKHYLACCTSAGTAYGPAFSCSLDAQLSQLEASLSSADKPTMQLLGQSTNRWLNPEHSQQPRLLEAARNLTVEQAAAAAHVSSAGDSNSKNSSSSSSSSSSQAEVGTGADSIAVAAVGESTSGSKGSAAEVQAAEPGGAIEQQQCSS
jgi:hypothetical protein